MPLRAPWWGLILVALTACAAPQTTRLVADPGSLPDRMVVSAPFFPQEALHCGPAALATVLTWAGDQDASPAALTAEAFTPGRSGSLRSDLVSAGRRRGFVVVPVRGLQDVLREIAAGIPVLVFQNLGLDWYPQWHFAVAVGFDLGRGEILLHSGPDRQRPVPLSTFEHTWSRAGGWAVVVVPPHRLPASADETTMLEAVVVLEGAGKSQEAETAYRAMLDPWPHSLGALMGLGNVLYARGDPRGAEDAFRRALAAHPAEPAPWNNLAYALSGQGRNQEAIDAAGMAVSLSVGDSARYLDTLADVSDGRPIGPPPPESR
jgi:hypothetical protein